jgi:uncharacterized protein
MKILFSPAETKKSGGVAKKMQAENFLFPELFEKREEVLQKYNGFIQSASDKELIKMFGIKDSAKFAAYKTDIFKMPLMKAIERYDGVAFDYLKYDTLDTNAQQYIDTNVLIFSNLFGVLQASDEIPEYKLKQGEKISNFATETFYKKHFYAALDALLQNEPFLDLRAGFYEKFYKPSSPYVTLKFLKEGKVVSHWAKAYRGLILRYTAFNNIQNIEAFMKMEIDTLHVKEILNKGIHTEIIYNITL